MSSPIVAQPNPFVDPNNALRQLNQYFGDLRKQYGEDAIRQMGFTPRDLAGLQASLRKLQMDPNATPEMHQQAYQQARDALAQKLTTPLAATRAYGVVSQPSAPASATGNDAIAVAPPVDRGPTQEQLYEYARGVARGETGQWDPQAQTFLMTGQPRLPQPEPVAPVMQAAPPLPTMSPEVAIQQTPVQTNPISNFIANMNAPGGATPPPATPFDRNSALRQLNQSFSNLRNTYGADALRGAGFMPRDLSALQASLRKLQLDNSSTQEQHTAALQNALNTMNQYTNNLKPIASPQPVAAPVAMPQMVAAPTPMPQPVATPTPMPTPVTGMYRGGFAVKR